MTAAAETREGTPRHPFAAAITARDHAALEPLTRWLAGPGRR